MVKDGTLRVQATNSPSGFEVTTDGVGVVGQAGAALLRELADRLGRLAEPVGQRHQLFAAVSAHADHHQLVSIRPGETALTRRGASSRASGGTVAS